jgi:hypothetical protein
VVGAGGAAVFASFAGASTFGFSAVGGVDGFSSFSFGGSSDVWSIRRCIKPGTDGWMSFDGEASDEGAADSGEGVTD